MNGVCQDSVQDCEDPHFKGTSCKDNCDDTGNDNCEECKRSGICTKCKNDKYFGEHCENECSKCPNGLCSNEGKCTDSTNNCLNNLYYGESCDNSCSKINANCQTCDRNGKCLSCKNNLFYGDKCENSCQNCPDGVCNMEGVCTKPGNCKNEEYFGDNCQKPCSEISSHCIKCSRDGKCLESDDKNHYGDHCE